MAGRPWRFTPDNRLFARALAVFMLGAAALAPLWEFPALLKVILLMGINVVVMPAVYVVVLVLSNRRAVMQGNTNAPLRNLLLLVGLGASLGLAVNKAPQYWTLLTGGAAGA
jgi:Flp pilus assembly protein TadB